MRFWVLFKAYGESQYVFRSHLTWVQAASSNHPSAGLSSSISSVLKALEALFGSVPRVHHLVASLCCVGSDPCTYTSGVSPEIHHSSFPKDFPLHGLLGTSQLCLFIPLAIKLVLCSLLPMTAHFQEQAAGGQMETKKGFPHPLWTQAPAVRQAASFLQSLGACWLLLLLLLLCYMIAWVWGGH